MEYILNFAKIGMVDIDKVGGKNASLGEMYQKLTPKGVQIPDGFAITTSVYWQFLKENNLTNPLFNTLEDLDIKEFSNLRAVGKECRRLILTSVIPYDIQVEILAAFQSLKERTNHGIQVAVRSSATAEDLPNASFAGQQESFLNITTNAGLLRACRFCLASLFTDRAIKYRLDNGFNHSQIALSIGVQQMVRSDKACAGVAFTLEPDTGFRDVVVINGAWGLGENVVKGTVDTDEFVVFKPSLLKGKKGIISKKVGRKQETMIYAESEASDFYVHTENITTPAEKKLQLVLTDSEIEKLARWCLIIESHYQIPMDIEWAKDGLNDELYIVQARPETVHTNMDNSAFKIFTLRSKSEVLVSGNGLGNKITAGKARILKSPNESWKLQKGEVLVTETTDPDWDPILKKCAAVITDKGGRTSHAAIVARELGAVAIVGATDATKIIQDGQMVTVSCAEGKTGFVYEGQLEWDEKSVDLKAVVLPNTEVMLILGNPDQAYQYAQFPNNGVGLMRMEFIINNAIQIHPMALVHFDKLTNEEDKEVIAKATANYQKKTDFFIENLSFAVATIAAAFYPKDVIVRMSDFKTNEYANLIGGAQFEPTEANPMIGFRGASRYTHDLYREGFKLECEAMKIIRNEMGLDNVKLMIPFCRTVEEGQKVIDLMATYGLKRKHQGLEIYTMIELPSNVLMAAEFAEIFDGFSIGSNDLTQLTLGLDRDNALVSSLFDERNPAVKTLIKQAIEVASEKRTKIGLCGQAPSDYLDYAKFLVAAGIDSISFNADALLQGIENVRSAEEDLMANDIY